MSWYGTSVTTEAIVLIVLLLGLLLGTRKFVNPDVPQFNLNRMIEKFNTLDRLVRLGIHSTLGFLLFVFISYGFPACATPSRDCPTKLQALIFSEPNAFGDALAGVFSALAFLWIIVTVLLQSKELKEQRLELVQMREEYAKQNELQERNIRILEKSEDRNRQKDADETLDKLLIEFVYAVDWYRQRRPYARWLFQPFKKEAESENTSVYCAELFFALRTRAKQANAGQLYSGSYAAVKWGAVTQIARSALALDEGLSAAGQQVLRQSRLKVFVELLEKIDERPELMVSKSKLEQSE